MKRVLVVLIAAFAVSGFAFADVVNSPHDLSIGSTGTLQGSTNVTNVCVFCHTPHMTNDAGTEYNQYPLWNHELSTNALYGVYASPTFDLDGGQNIADIGGATLGTASVSNLCMSCHDGTIGLGSLYNNPNYLGVTPPSNAGTTITGSANMGTSLVNDHPINFLYADSDAADPDIVAEGTVPPAMLFGGTVQCSSCHDPHLTANGAFLVLDNTDSALCTTCHIK